LTNQLAPTRRAHGRPAAARAFRPPQYIPVVRELTPRLTDPAERPFVVKGRITMLTHLKNHLVGYVALFLVLGTGTAYANHLQVFSSDIVDGQVNSVDVRDDGLTGNDIAENTLSVPKMGCQIGTIHGFARIKGSAVGSSTWTAASSAIDTKYNCKGNPVYVRKTSTGVYYVWFVGNPSALALTLANSDNKGLESTENDNFVTVSKQPSTGIFRVEVQDAGGSNGSDPQDGQFTIALL
jgi:hypothetical protein